MGCFLSTELSYLLKHLNLKKYLSTTKSRREVSGAELQTQSPELS